ncbi:MAG: LD-carboxypeptidase [Bacteroidetes bacterium]|nr:LD-carboxypeptidase [Bacteroidota bacterium]
MNRKNFLSSLVTLGAAGPALASQTTPAQPAARTTGHAAQPTKHTAQLPEQTAQPFPLIIPPYLKSGDTIGITCPAGNITAKEIQPAVQLIESWGFHIKVGDTVGKKDSIFGGTDSERAADFQKMLDDPDISAILCARGGYGSAHLIDQINFLPLVRHPKWIIGFSDITVILCHIHTNFNIAGIHSKMCNSFPDDWNKAEPVQVSSILSIKQALIGEKMQYSPISNPGNRPGMATGQLIGGNLKTIETLAGTPSDIDTKGKILFVEDTGEYLYSIDRMFWHLQRSGKLAGLAGLVIGGFKVKPDDAGEEFGRTVYEIVSERIKPYSFPVCFDFPVGHQKENYALKYGMPHILDTRDSKQPKLYETSII